MSIPRAEIHNTVYTLLISPELSQPAFKEYPDVSYGCAQTGPTLAPCRSVLETIRPRKSTIHDDDPN